MKLSELFKGKLDINTEHDVDIISLAQDSREVTNNSLFFAYPGMVVDGRDYIEQAIARGAIALVIEADSETVSYESGLIKIEMPNVSHKVGEIAARFYGEPSTKFPIIGVTGTNGKTTITHLIAQAFEAEHRKAAVIGTIGNGILNDLQTPKFTTPFSIGLQSMLAHFAQQKPEVLAMEVSSHALAQGRPRGTQFHAAIFSNLTRDHLDYHQDMESYAASKHSLFTDYAIQHAIVNADDIQGQKILRSLPTSVNVLSYSINGQLADVVASDINTHGEGIKAQIKTPWGDAALELPLLGRFNVSNALAVIAVLGTMNWELPRIMHALKQCHGVAGRMQWIKQAHQATSIIDYAHTPDALQHALLAAREHCSGKLYCVFGCGGDRDVGKRALMAAVAERHADQVMVCDDNPRGEDPEVIFKDIAGGFSESASAQWQHDRKQAIYAVLDQASVKDMVLIAGKGHEDYQEIAGKRYPLSDELIVKSFAREITQ